MAMDGESVESVELAIGQWTRDDRGRPSIVSSSFRPPAGAATARPPRSKTEFRNFIPTEPTVGNGGF